MWRRGRHLESLLGKTLGSRGVEILPEFSLHCAAKSLLLTRPSPFRILVCSR